jgi:hypothetical protein
MVYRAAITTVVLVYHRVLYFTNVAISVPLWSALVVSESRLPTVHLLSSTPSNFLYLSSFFRWGPSIKRARKGMGLGGGLIFHNTNQGSGHTLAADPTVLEIIWFSELLRQEQNIADAQSKYNNAQ